jgi:hypothetical protein
MSKETLRYCRSCPKDNPTALSSYNKRDQCYSCWEKAQLEELKALCSCCQRESSDVRRSRYGKLCCRCYKRIKSQKAGIAP